MKNKKLLILIPALAMVLGGCKDKPTEDPKPGTDTTQPDNPSDNVVHPESVSLDNTELNMNVGDEVTIKATVAPTNVSNDSVTYLSDHPEIVSVTERGKLTAKAEGTATITVTTVDGGKTAQCVVTVVLPIWGTEEEPINITTALATAEAKLTTAKAASNDVAFITGYVISASEGTSKEGVKYASNIYLADSKDETDAAKKLLVYSADYNPNKSITALYAGDKVVVKGYLQQYARNDTDPKENWTLEVTKYNDVNPALVGYTAGSSTVTLGSHDNAEVTGLPTAPVKNGSEFEFVVTPANGYNISSVTCNGAEATPVAEKPNAYKGKVTGPTTVLVTAVKEGVTILNKEIVSPKTSSALLGDGVDNSATLGLDGHFKVTAEQGDASSNVACYDQIRLYAYNVKPDQGTPEDSKKGNNNKLKFEGVGITFTSVYVETSQNHQYLKVLAGDQEVTTESTAEDKRTYNIDAKTFTLTNSYNVATASTHVYITKIIVYYTEDPRIAATGIEVSKNAVTLKPELSEVVTATVSPADSTDMVEWTSADPTIATVSGGKITAVKAGNTTVTAKAGDYSKDIAVTVEAYPTYTNLTGETLTPVAEYYDAGEGKGLEKDPCILAGYITDITNANYGNGWLRTTDGIRVQLYGMYDITGYVKYSEMTEHKPQVGDFVILKGQNINFNGPELKNGKILQVNDYKCEIPAVTALAAVENAKVEVDKDKTADVKKQLNITPKGGNISAMTFVSANPAIATVDADGIVTGVAGGETTITCTLDGFDAVVIPVKVNGEVATKYEMAFGTDNGGYNNSNQNSYANMYDVTIENVKWKVPGNLSFKEGLKIGGKNAAEVTRSIYSIDKLEGNVNSVAVTFGTKDNEANCTKVTFSVYSSAADAAAGDASKAVYTADGTYAVSSTTTFAAPEGTTWNGGFYRFDFVVSLPNNNSNKGIRSTNITFNFAA